MVITEPDLLAKEILTNREGLFPKFKATDAVKKLIGGESIFLAEVEKWLKLANHAFYAESLKVRYYKITFSTFGFASFMLSSTHFHHVQFQTAIRSLMILFSRR